MRKTSAKRAAARARIAAILLLALALAPPVRLAAQDLDGLPLKEIRFVGLQTLSDETLRYYLSLEEGDPLDWEGLNDRIHILWQTKLIDDITVESRPLEDGVLLEITVKERPTLKEVEYQGLKKVGRTDVSDRIAKDRIGVREGDPLELGELRRLKGAIEELYEEKGFRLAEADFYIEEVGPGERRVTFTVDEGDKVRIGEIDFEGNTVFGDRRLQWAMKKTKESGLLTRVLKKDVFNQAEFEEDMDKVREVYRQTGYKNVVLGEPEIEVVAAKPGAADVADQKRRLRVTIPVEEGDRWKLGEITVEGNEKFSDEILLSRFRRPRGGWLRSNVVDEGIEAISEVYSNTGYLFSRVQPELVEREDQVADLIVHVQEGDQFRVATIEFEGNTKTRDKVIRREMGIQEGMVMNSGALRNSLLRIRQLEFYKVDEEDPVEFDVNYEEKTVDLRINGEEGDRTELLFGGGYSELDGLFGQFSFRTRNFLGRGETLAASFQSGRRQDFFDLSYQIPWFLDRPQSVGIQVFDRRLDYNLLTGQQIFQDTTGGAISYGKNLGLFKSIQTSYTLYDSEDRRTLLALDGSLVEQQFLRSVSMARLRYVFDKRDSRLQPTVGMRYSGGVEYAGGPLGGSTDFIRLRADWSYYRPLTKEGLRTVGAINVEAGWIKPLGGDELFFNDRFYLGGENSLRGHRYRSIWVRDDDGRTLTDEFGVPLGGDRFLLMNLEYHLLVGGPFRIIGFLDAGQVVGDDQSVDFDRFRYTSGLEMQVNVPLFGAPLRFIYAFNLDPLDDDRFESFQFSIGPSF